MGKSCFGTGIATDEVLGRGQNSSVISGQGKIHKHWRLDGVSGILSSRDKRTNGSDKGGKISLPNLGSEISFD